MATTLNALVRAIADAVRDLHEATATSATSSTSTFKAAEDLYEDDRYFRGAEAYVAAGTAANLGLTRRISDNDLETQTLTFVTPLNVIAQVGDKLEITNLSSQGWRRVDYIRAANAAITEAHPHNRVVSTANGATTFLTDGLVAIPTAFTHLYGVEWQDTNGLWWPIRFTSTPSQGWFIDWTSLSVGLRGDVAGSANGRPLRFLGFTRAAELVNGSDSTETDKEYLVNYAAGSLILAKRREDNQSFGQYFLNRADALRAKMVRPAPAGTVQVRP